MAANMKMDSLLAFRVVLIHVSDVSTASIIVVLMMAAVRTSETSMHFTKTTLHYIPEGCHLYSFIFS
jgi:hypothetical protein